MSEHTLRREVVEYYEYDMKLVDWDERDFNPDDEEGKELQLDWDQKVYCGSDEKATIECSCGERFRKEATAIAHLEEVSA